MGFRLTYNKLSDSDKRLVDGAIHDVRCSYRPAKVHIDEAHEGEIVGWDKCLPEELITPEINLNFGSRQYLMTHEGFVYFLPILLALVLFEPLNDFVFYFVDKYRSEILDNKLVCSCSLNTKLLANRWIEICSPWLWNELEIEEDEPKFSTKFTKVFDHILNSPTQGK